MVDRPSPVLPAHLFASFLSEPVPAPEEQPERIPWMTPPPELSIRTTVVVVDGLRSRARPWFGSRGEWAVVEAHRAYAELVELRERWRVAEKRYETVSHLAFARAGLIEN